MRFIDYKENGPPDVLYMNEKPIPSLMSHEILIRVEACGINRADIFQREGQYPPPTDASPILGLEVAGTVCKVGSNVQKWKEGDAVCALTHGGGYAEFCVAAEDVSLPIPKGFDFVAAASLPEAYFTVWSNLFMRTSLRKGETILIHGGSSGIGSCAIQLAKVFDAYVVTTVGSQEKADFCLSLGADEIIKYNEEDFVLLLKKKGVDVVLDIFGGECFEKNLSVLKEEGRLIQIASMLGTKGNMDIRKLLTRRLTIVGSTLRPQSLAAKGKIAQELKDMVWPLFETNQLKSVVTTVFPLHLAGDAHRLMESKRHMGKIVLTIENR